MNKNTKKQKQFRLDTQRREFIKKTTMVGAGLVAGSALPVSAMPIETAENRQSPKQKGYQVTQHVVDYYKSAAS